MNDYNIWKEKVEENYKRNDKFIQEFENWLIQKKTYKENN